LAVKSTVAQHQFTRMEDTSESNGSSSNGSSDDELSSGPKLIRGENGVLLTAGILVADVVGAGVLAMPVAIARFGWLLGAIMTVGLLVMNLHVSILLWRVKMDYLETHTYTELVGAVFASAGPNQKNAMMAISAWSQFCFLCGLLGLYVLTIGSSLGMLFHDVQICLPMWAFIGSVIVLPFVLTSRRMGSWKSLVWLNVLTLLGTIFIPLGYMAAHGKQIRPHGSHVYAVADMSIKDLLNGLSIMTFAFTSQFMLVEVISEMKDPAKLPKAYLRISAPFQGLAFLITGLGGYYFMGDRVEGMISEYLPFGMLSRICATCLFTHIAISYVIKNVVVSGAIHQKLDKKHAHGTSSRTLGGWGATVFLVLCAAYTFANVVPFFTDLVELLGASSTPISCFIVPIITFVRWYLDGGKEKRNVSVVEWVIIAIEMLLALTLTIFGTVSAMATVLQHWDSYGYPFECHCQGLWNTCECSDSHLGMEHCEVTG